jgi:hypothetical protein
MAIKTSNTSGTSATIYTIDPGDIGITLPDGKLWVSDGNTVHEVGANLQNLSVGGNISIGNSSVNTNITSANLETSNIFADTLEIYNVATINTHSMTIGTGGVNTIITADTITLGGKIVFDTDYVVSPTPAGTLAWNTLEDCLNIFQADGSTLQTGLENYIRVRNHTGSTISAGTLVQFTGVNGSNDPTCAPLLANSTFDSIYTIGVVTTTILDDGIGRATNFGKVRELNTTGSSSSESWAIGDILYASPTLAGKLTKVKPTAPNPSISVAAVTKVGTTDGELLVRPLIVPRLFYGSFSSNVTQNCASSNTATPVTFNDPQFSSGHNVITYQTVPNAGVQAVYSGLYNYQFSMQLQSSSSNKHEVWIWARKNGTDIVDSATRVSIESNGGMLVPAWNFVVSMAASDVFQLMWAVDDHTKISMVAEANTAFCPSIPSVLLSVTQVNQ